MTCVISISISSTNKRCFHCQFSKHSPARGRSKSCKPLPVLFSEVSSRSMANSQINWLLLVNAALGNFLAGTGSRIFAVSMPTVAAGLETTIVGISWAVIAYQISQISLSFVFGRIGDIYGRHTLFGLGLIVSAIAALLCGLSQNVTQLILFRLFQGIGASMTQTQGRALALEAAPKELSGRA